MSDDTKQQPYRPPVRASNRYAGVKEPEATRHELFSMSITASTKGERMNEPELNPEFLIDLIFKPNESGLKLRPAETQLLLAYIGEILQEIEAEEKLIIEEERAKLEQGKMDADT